MILKQEILKIATDNQLSPHVIEKDYVLGWLLAGINHHPYLTSHWVFKGGTCLKKCYFETYRFSEDLDFTVIDPKHLNQSLLQGIFKDISQWIYQNSGIEIPEEKITFELYENPRGSISCQGKIYYRGPLAPISSKCMPRIKLDITTDELIANPTIVKSVTHAYSDLPHQGIQTLCYSYIEIFAEKIRALTERARARDLYDIIHLFRRPESEKLVTELKSALLKKCEFKKIALPTYEKTREREAFFSSAWQDQLSHQLQALPAFDSFWNELLKFFDWLHNQDSVEILPKISDYSSATEQEIKNYINSSHKLTKQANLLEKIRFAAANHLCIEINYGQKEGKTFLIEPYALVKDSEKNLLIYALINQTKEIKTFRTDLLKNVEILSHYFTPSFQVELLSNL